MNRTFTMCKHGFIRISLIVFVIAFAVSSDAHDARPVVVDIEQAENFSLAVTIKVPATLDYYFRPTVYLPGSCEPSGEALVHASNSAYLHQTLYQCDKSLSGESIGLDYPSVNPSLSSMFKVALYTGETITRILPPGEDRWVVPTESTFGGVASDYTNLGFTHILRGFDHLLFVLCLLLVAGTKWRILAAITGFTIAHSITLALATFDYLRISVPAIEAIIALSIVFLAAEIVRGNKGSLTWRYPIIIASVFGLLHGLGFASALAEVGLPQAYRIQALVFFNIGVEFGQLFFIASLLLAVAVLRKSTVLLNDSGFILKIRVACVYAIGFAGVYWFVDRSLLALTLGG